MQTAAQQLRQPLRSPALPHTLVAARTETSAPTTAWHHLLQATRLVPRPLTTTLHTAAACRQCARLTAPPLRSTPAWCSAAAVTAGTPTAATRTATVPATGTGRQPLRERTRIAARWPPRRSRSLAVAAEPLAVVVGPAAVTMQVAGSRHSRCDRAGAAAAWGRARPEMQHGCPCWKALAKRQTAETRVGNGKPAQHMSGRLGSVLVCCGFASLADVVKCGRPNDARSASAVGHRLWRAAAHQRAPSIETECRPQNLQLLRHRLLPRLNRRGRAATTAQTPRRRPRPRRGLL